MTETLILIVLVLICITLTSINYKLEHIATALAQFPRLDLALTDLADVELPCLTAAVSEVSRSIDDAAEPVTYNRN